MKTPIDVQLAQAVIDWWFGKVPNTPDEREKLFKMALKVTEKAKAQK